MAERGGIVTYEMIRHWCQKREQCYANQLGRRRARIGDNWHLDQVFLRINGKLYYLWRAVDQNGKVLDVLVQSQRNKQAALRFFRKFLKDCQYVPRVLITDKLGSCGAAKREILPHVDHRQHWRRNNRAENARQPRRQRERTMRQFTSAGYAQRFLAAFGAIVTIWHITSVNELTAVIKDIFGEALLLQTLPCVSSMHVSQFVHRNVRRYACGLTPTSSLNRSRNVVDELKPTWPTIRSTERSVVSSSVCA